MTESALKSPPINHIIRGLVRALLWFRRLFLRRRVSGPVLEKAGEDYFLVLPEVQNPVVFRSGLYFAQVIAGSGLARPGPGPASPRALDMGTGSGICAIHAARLGYRVTGVDLNPAAVRCATVNVLLHQLESRIEIRQGDLFAPVARECFDLVLFNPPFYRGDPEGLFDLSWHGRDVFERFAAGLAKALAPGGRALVLLSTDGDAPGMLGALETCGFRVTPAARHHFGNEIMTVYEVRPAGASG